jgi:4-hydroxy-3-polyprenylbenzoate decarboxylase
MMTGRPITVAWTGASGLAYGVRLVEVLLNAGVPVHLLRSEAVDQTAAAELDRSLADVLEGLRASAPDLLREHGKHDFSASVASGSAPSRGMVVCPCSMSSLARIASGTGETLMHRAADVCLKERRTLIVVPRETPLATHHLENMTRLSRNGAVVLPAMPGFYNGPESVADLVDFVVQRICDRLGVEVDLTKRWGVDG